MISVEKPGSPHDLVLIHYGKKGMKWGVRNRVNRAREQNRAVKKAQKQYTSSRSSRRAMTKEERITSLRLTNGEKFVVGLLAAFGGVTGVTVAGATVGSRVGYRKYLERKA